MHPVNRRVTAQYLHTQSVTTRRRCGRNSNQEAPREVSAPRGIGIAADQVKSKVSGAAGGGGMMEEAVEGGRCPRDDAWKGVIIVWQCHTEKAIKAWHRQERQEQWHKHDHQRTNHAANKQPTNNIKTCICTPVIRQTRLQQAQHLNRHSCPMNEQGTCDVCALT